MEGVLSSVFEFLFKYRPVAFERGTLVFASDAAAWMAVGLGLLVAIPVLVGTWRLRAGARRRDRAVLIGLRVAAMALVALCLFRPALLLSEAAPRRNVLAVLVDDSRSMRIPDADGQTRAAVAQALLAADAPLARALADRFVVRTFRFSDAATRATGSGALGFDGPRTDVSAALRQVRAELAGVPLAGIVLVSDGADNAPAASAATTALDAGSDVPIYTVGIGAERPERDVEVVRVDAPRSALAGSAVSADVTLAQYGMGGRTARLVVEEDGRILSQRDVTLPRDGERQVVRVAVPAESAGVRRLQFRVVPGDGERMAENNVREALVQVRRGPDRILYIEGEPRFELKFLRRAVADDDGLRVIALQRTAENKYLRLGVEDSLQLAAGFPATREELFGYRAVVLGSIEASHFTAAQLRLIADFVGERGGGLLFLGGRRSFREGGYAGSPLAEVMPVELGEPAARPEPESLAELAVRPTAAGAAHALSRLAETEDSSAARWSTLPPLTTVNRVRGVKPGATVLLSGASTAAGSDDAVPVLAWHRYGRGIAASLTVQDSWMWQMHADVSEDDQTHERFWRQLLRWLAAEAPDRAVLAGGPARLGAGEMAVLRADVRDSAFRGVNDAAVTATVRAPSGAEREVRLAWTGEGDGDYRASFAAEEDGVHEVRLAAARGDEMLNASDAFLRAADGAEEFFEAGMRAPLLRRLASESGGQFYTPATAGALARDVVYTRSGNTVLERKPLWDMPAVLLLLVTLLSAEWAYRRWRGLV